MGSEQDSLLCDEWRVENWASWPALIRFHFARRFCHQIFTWISLRFNVWAIWERSTNERYFFCWNSVSNSINCSLVKAVRFRRWFVELLFEENCSSSSLSLGVEEFKLSTKPNKSMIRQFHERFRLYLNRMLKKVSSDDYYWVERRWRS